MKTNQLLTGALALSAWALSALAASPALADDAPTELAHQSFKLSAKTDERALIAQFFNREAKKPGSPLNKSLEALRKQYNDTGSGNLTDTDRDDLWKMDRGQSGGVFSTEWTVPVAVEYKSSTFYAGYYWVETSVPISEDKLTVTIVSQSQVDIKNP